MCGVIHMLINETVRDRLRLESVLKKVERRRGCWKDKVESRKGSVGKCGGESADRRRSRK